MLPSSRPGFTVSEEPEPLVGRDLTRLSNARTVPLLTTSGDAACNKRKRRKRGLGLATSKKRGLAPTTLTGPCAYVSINSLIAWSGRGESSLLPLSAFWETLDKMKAARMFPHDGGDLGYYNCTTDLSDMQLHWTCLTRMCSLHKLTLKKCKNDKGNWRDAGWMCKQKTGLFLLFGYVSKASCGHYVAMNAAQNCIVDSLYPLEPPFDISAASFKAIFTSTKQTGSDVARYGAFDCAFELI